MEEKKSKKPTYEELEAKINALSKQNEQLYRNLMQANYTELLNRLSFLFKVIEFKNSFSPEFVVRCSEEIENIITVPNEADSNEE